MSASAIDNTVQQWLYNQNPNLQISPRRVLASNGTQLLIGGPGFTQFAFTTQATESFDLDDGVLIEEVKLSLSGSTPGLTPTTTPEIFAAAAQLQASTASIGEQIGQPIFTLPYIPYQVNGLLGIEFITLPSCLLYPARDAVKNKTLAGSTIAFPATFTFTVNVDVWNPNAAGQNLNFVYVVKYRHVHGISAEG